MAAGVTTFADTGLTEATSYSYLVTAFNAAGSSPAAIAGSSFTLPAAPSGLVASPASATSINLTFQNNSAAAIGFIIQRSLDGIHFETVVSPASTTLHYVDTGLTEAVAYYYRALTTGPGHLTSAPSNTTNVITNPAAPEQPKRDGNLFHAH